MSNIEDVPQPAPLPEGYAAPAAPTVPAYPQTDQQQVRTITKGSVWYFVVSIGALFFAPVSIFAAFAISPNHTTPAIFAVTAIAYIAGAPLLITGIVQLRRAAKNKLGTPFWVAGIICSSILTVQLVFGVVALILVFVGLRGYNGG
jgi:hypothetical protein